MSKIQIQKVTNINLSTKAKGYATRIVNRENLTMEQLAAEAAIGSTYSEGEILGVMKHIFDAAARKFADGKGVSMGALGTLMPGLKSKWSATPEGQTKSSLTLYAKYEPTKKIQDAVENAELVWVSRAATDSTADSDEEPEVSSGNAPSVNNGGSSNNGDSGNSGSNEGGNDENDPLAPLEP